MEFSFIEVIRRILAESGFAAFAFTAFAALTALRSFGGAGTRQCRLVLFITGSHTYRIAGSRNSMHSADITEPRASMMHMLLIISILEISPTPRVARNSTIALVIIDESDADAAVRMAAVRFSPLCSSSRKRVVSSIA